MQRNVELSVILKRTDIHRYLWRYEKLLSQLQKSKVYLRRKKQFETEQIILIMF